MITVQPIVYTADTGAWHTLATDLGLAAAFPPGPVWAEFDGRGVLAVHGVDPDDPHRDRTDLHLLAEDLGAAESALTAAGFDVVHTPLADVGDMLRVVSTSGVAVTVSQGERSARSGPMAVLPIWYADDLDEPGRLLTALGLRPRISSESGGWHDFVAPGGGLVALHTGTARVDLAFEFAADLDELAGRLVAAGHPAVVLDEAYNRTVRFAGPDDREIWVNEVQTDLYGFREHA